MVPFAHIDNKVFSVRAALGLGLRHFEHAHTLAVEAATGDELAAADQRMLVALAPPQAARPRAASTCTRWRCCAGSGPGTRA
jgi:hypothetical protein